MKTRSIESVVLIAVMLQSVSHGQGQLFSTDNLLVNPGGETGMIDPWELGIFHGGTSLSDSAGALPPGNISATEGNYWFRSEGEIVGSANTGGTIAVDFLSVRQTVDVRSFSELQAVTVGGDYFAVGELVSGSGNPVFRPDNALRFLDESMELIEGAFALDLSLLINADPPGIVDDFRVTVTDIPDGTAFITYIAKAAFGVRDQTPTDPGTVRGIVGIDDLLMSVTYVPEPGGCTLVAIGVLAVFVSRRNRPS